MKTVYLIIWILLWPAMLTAQTPSLWLLSGDSVYDGKHALMMLNGSGAAGSPVLDLGFQRTLFFGGEIGQDHIEDLHQGMTEVNRGGAEWSAGLQFMGFRDSLLGKPQLGLQIRLSSEAVYQTGFTDDLFGLVFQGNAAHRGDSLSTGPLYLQQQVYQKFGVGLFDKRHYSGFVVSLVSGQDYRMLDVRNSHFYTSAEADSLALSYEGDYERADTSKSGWGTGKGLGVCVDFDYNFPLVSGKGFISLSVRDLGVVAWNKASEQYRFDSLTSWLGYPADNLFDLDADSLDFPNLRDSVYVDESRGVMWRMLPMSVGFRLLHHAGNRMAYEAGLNIRPGRLAVPVVYAGLIQRPTPRLMITERLVYGGYGRLRAGLAAEWMPQGKWYLRAGTNNVAGLFSDRARSLEFFVSLAHVFGTHNTAGTPQ